MREEWTEFFSTELRVLSANYPGLSLSRFLMEVQDILILRHHPQLRLDQSRFSVSPLMTKKLSEEFLRGVPFGYLTRHSEFYGHSFFIDENVLIPRPETELLVDLLVQKKKTFKHVLDVGTGSGVIILSLLAAQIAESGVAVDLSPAALKVAQINAIRMRLGQRCEFLVSDRFQKVQGNFDLIVSNPPYIKSAGHRELVHRKVDEFEPSMALYIPDETYDLWFADFFQGIKAHLNQGGVFMMEGHELELEKQAQQLRDLGFENVRVICDYAGAKRFIEAYAK